MKVTYDPSVDALYIRFKQARVTTEHWTDSVAANFDEAGQLAGIEILDASELLSDIESLKKVDFEEFSSAVGPRQG